METLLAINATAQLAQGISSGINNYFTNKTNFQVQKAQLNREAIPLYQQIGSQARQLMNQQALSYINSGVDITQGTANYVIEHTQKQSELKMNEIKDNLDMQIKNAKRLSSSQASSGIFQTIFNSILNTTQLTSNIKMSSQNVY